MRENCQGLSPSRRVSSLATARAGFRLSPGLWPRTRPRSEGKLAATPGHAGSGAGGGAAVAVAGHARLRARLLKHGGGGVKTGTGSLDQCDRISLFSPTRLEVRGDSRPREYQRGAAVASGLWSLSAGGWESSAARPPRGTPPHRPAGSGPSSARHSGHPLSAASPSRAELPCPLAASPPRPGLPCPT